LKLIYSPFQPSPVIRRRYTETVPPLHTNYTAVAHKLYCRCTQTIPCRCTQTIPPLHTNYTAVAQNYTAVAHKLYRAVGHKLYRLCTQTVPCRCTQTKPPLHTNYIVPLNTNYTAVAHKLDHPYPQPIQPPLPRNYTYTNSIAVLHNQELNTD